MKWMFWLLAILTVAAALPSAEAAIRFQSVGSSFTDFSGPSSLSAYGSSSSMQASWNHNQINVRAASSQHGGFAVDVQRPTYVRHHTFADHNQNYRTLEHGNWQVRQVQANHKSSRSALSYGQTPAGPHLSAFTGGYGHRSPSGSYNTVGARYGFDRAHNTGVLRNPWVGNSYQQPATLTARTAPRSYW